MQDMDRLSATHGYAISHSAPHVYISASVFTPQESPLFLLSQQEFQIPPKLVNPSHNLWGPELLTLDGHTYKVNSVAFSPDGKKIVSGSADNTLRVWDAESGLAILGPLQGHKSSVTSVA